MPTIRRVSSFTEENKGTPSRSKALTTKEFCVADDINLSRPISALKQNIWKDTMESEAGYYYAKDEENNRQ